MRIPQYIVAGDSAAWSDFAFVDSSGMSVDAVGFTLTYSLRGPIAAAKKDIVGQASGTGWKFSLAVGDTAAFNPGTTPARWYWTAYASKQDVRITAGEGVLVVRPNLAAATTFDGRSRAEQILATVESAIQARAGGDMVTEYTIGTRSLKKEPMSELLALRDRYRTIVSRERKAQAIKNGLGNPSRVGVRFRPY